jgi:hypothetical protein
MGWFSRRALLASVCICALSCNGADPASKPSVPIGGDGDGDGDRDASVEPSSDGAIDPAGDAGPDFRGCAESAERFREPFDPGGRGFDLLVDGLDVHLAYTAALCRGVGTDVLGHELRYAKFASSGDTTAPKSIAVAAVDRCALVRDPLLLKESPSNQAGLYFLSRSEGPWALFRTVPGDEVPMIKNMALASSGSDMRELSGAHHQEVSSLAWVEERAGEKDRIILFRSGTRYTVLEEGRGLSVAALSLGTLGSGDASSMLLAFGSQGDNRDYYLLGLKDDGSAGSLAPLGGDVGGSPVVSLAQADVGGGFIYTEGPGAGEELRFLALDGTGEPRTSERKLTTGNESIRGPQVIAFATGYAVAYRVVRPEAPDTAMVRLAFLDSEGNLAGTRDLFETSSSGGVVQLRASVDGRLVLAFAEVDGDGVFTLQVARVTCNG